MHASNNLEKISSPHSYIKMIKIYPMIKLYIYEEYVVTYTNLISK